MNVVVRNGAIRDWVIFGVGTANTTGGRYERLQLLRNGSAGLNVCDTVRGPS